MSLRASNINLFHKKCLDLQT